MTTLNKDTKVPLYVVGSAIFLTALIVSMWMDLRYEVRQSFTVNQMQEWLDAARDKNHQSNPSVVFPPVPPRQESAEKVAENLVQGYFHHQ